MSRIFYSTRILPLLADFIDENTRLELTREHRTLIGHCNSYSFPGSIWSHDQSQRSVEGDDMSILRAEAPNALDEQLIDDTHLYRLISSLKSLK